MWPYGGESLPTEQGFVNSHSSLVCTAEVGFEGKEEAEPAIPEFLKDQLLVLWWLLPPPTKIICFR